MSRNTILVIVVAAGAVLMVIGAVISLTSRPQPVAAPTGGQEMPTLTFPNEPCEPIVRPHVAESIEETEKLVVNIARYPAGVTSVEELSAGYDDGQTERRFSVSDGKLVLQGPNKLGGELAVYIAEPNKPLRLWCYVRKLEKRQVTVPDDAELVVSDDRLVDASLSFAAEDAALLRNVRAVAFYTSPDSKQALFYWPVGTSLPKAGPAKVPVRITPGRYFVRAIVEKAGQLSYVPLGMLEVTAEKQKTYPLELPYK